MDCLQNAGRQTSYRDCTLYTSLSPCMMCSGTIVQFKIPRVVICENRNFGGNEQFLRDHGVEVEVVADTRCIDLMARFIAENGALCAEDNADSRHPHTLPNPAGPTHWARQHHPHTRP